MSITAASSLGLSASRGTAIRPAPILMIRSLHYVAEDCPGALPPVRGLRATALGIVGAQAEQDPQSGLIGFQDLPPGQRQILLTDPERRFLPSLITVAIPARHPTRPTAPDSAPQAALARPTVKLRPAPGRAIPAGMTAVIGTLRDATGHGIALAVLGVESVVDGRPARCITWTAEDGSFALWLPGEAAGLDTAAPPPQARRFTLQVPGAALAAALALDFFGALPPDLDGMDTATRPDLFRPATLILLGADGAPAEAAPGWLPIRPARTQRWDMRLDH